MKIAQRAGALPLSLVVAVAATLGGGAHAAAGEPSVVIVPGDTLSGIAAAQGVSVEQIVSLNGLPDPDRIFVGQHLVLVPAAPAPETPAPGAGHGGTHLVQPGENLTWIAAQYGTTVEAIAAANAIANPGLIFAGQQLVIPGTLAAAEPVAEAAPPSAPTADAASPEPFGPQAGAEAVVAAPEPPAAVPWQEHAVAPGENLTWIAASYGTTIAEVVTANGIVDPSFIRAGDVLRIPVPGAASETGVAAAPPAGLPSWMTELAAARSDVRAIIVEQAQAMGVPPALALAVAWHESGWQQGVVSSAGAVGVMQLLPTTGDWVAGSMLGEPVDLADTPSNVRAGVRLLAYYLARYDGERSLVLAAYYQGQTATDENGIYPTTVSYIASIVALEVVFGG